MDSEAILLVILIFSLRVINNSLGTIRIIMMTYGRRGTVFVLAFLEALIFAFTAAQVLTDLSNIPNLMSYALGFAVGGYVGMLLEDHFVSGYVAVNIISRNEGHKIAVFLRKEGYGVTETRAEGGKGSVTVLHCVVERHQISKVTEIAYDVNPEAFITVEEAKFVQHGWLQRRRLLRR